MATQEKELPKLGIGNKLMLLRSINNPEYFKESARPKLYSICEGDPETVHEVMLDTLHNSGSMLSPLGRFFKAPDALKIEINGSSVVPFGTAAGMDKNGEALQAFQHIFGFQEPGTVVLPVRAGNPKVRVATLEMDMDLLNAQGFPSKGLEHFLNNLIEYRKSGGDAKIYVSICGLPISETDVVKTAMNEMETLLKTLVNYVDGFVWNPFSPNTAALKQLRDPQVFYETAKLMKDMAPDKLRMVKIGPYEPGEREAMMQLVGKFIEGGGHGVVTTNTKTFLKDQLPEEIREKWGYSGAGRSGAFLESYMLRSVNDIRREFPDSTIFATGGIYTAKIAYAAFSAGANALEGYTPYTYFGPGLVRKLMDGVMEDLEKNKLRSLSELQATAKDLARKA